MPDGPREKIAPVARLKGIGHPQNALQSMPMLVWNNKNGIRQNEGPAANRVAVGVTRDNDKLEFHRLGPTVQQIHRFRFGIANFVIVTTQTTEIILDL